MFCFLFCSNIATEDMLYTESDIENSMDKIETINFHQVLNELLIEIRSNKGWCNTSVIFNEFFKVLDIPVDTYHYIKEFKYFK